MDLRLKDNVVLVTGSSKGIGFKIAEILCAEGCRVALNARNVHELEIAVAKLPRAIGFVGDVSNPGQANLLIERILEEYQQLDGVICNVGSGRSVNPGDETYDEWQRMFAVNLWSTTNIVEAASKALFRSKGSIVCTSSICGLELIPAAPLTYSAAKAALHAYVRGVSRPLGKNGVRINAIAPGNILFEGSVWERKLEANIDEVTDMLNRDIALGKLGSPEDVANLAAYLLSPVSGFATGAVWTIDGGQIRS